MKATRPLQICLAICLFTLAAFAQNPAIPKPPDTPKHPVTDEYQGVKVADDYRWIENWDDPAVKQWSAAENARTREYLDRLPSRAAIKDRLQQLAAASSAAYWDLQFRGGTLFSMKFQPPQQQPLLVAMHSADDPASAKVIFDPNHHQGIAVRSVLHPFAGRQVRRRGAHRRRLRGLLGSHFRSRHRQGTFRHGPPRKLRHRRRQYRLEGRRLRLSITRVIRRATSVPRRTPTSTSKSTFTSSAPMPGRTPTSSAKISPASPRFSSTPATMAAGCSPQ